MPLVRGRDGKCNAKGCMVIGGDRGRYLVNMGEKCNLMIPWTKVQKIFIAHMVQTTHKPLFYNSFYNWYQGLLK